MNNQKRCSWALNMPNIPLKWALRRKKVSERRAFKNLLNLRPKVLRAKRIDRTATQYRQRCVSTTHRPKSTWKTQFKTINPQISWVALNVNITLYRLRKSKTIKTLAKKSSKISKACITICSNSIAICFWKKLKSIKTKIKTDQVVSTKLNCLIRPHIQVKITSLILPYRITAIKSIKIRVAKICKKYWLKTSHWLNLQHQNRYRWTKIYSKTTTILAIKTQHNLKCLWRLTTLICHLL